MLNPVIIWISSSFIPAAFRFLAISSFELLIVIRFSCLERIF